MATLGTILMQPLHLFAAIWHKAAFETANLDEAIMSLGVYEDVVSEQIQIIASDRAENGAIVQVEVKSEIANTETIYIFAEKNPTPLIACFNFSNGAEPYVITRIKMAASANIKIIVKADGHFYTNTKSIEVLENGCG